MKELENKIQDLNIFVCEDIKVSEGKAPKKVFERVKILSPYFSQLVSTNTSDFKLDFSGNAPGVASTLNFKIKAALV